MMRALNLTVDPARFSFSFRRPPLCERSGRPIFVGMGDDVVGPFVGLFFDAPSSPEALSDPPDLTPPHGHPCDNFRIVMKGELWVGRERYHHGEFRLQRSGTPYGADGDVPHLDGNWRIIVFADRRGHMTRPTSPSLREEMLGAAARTRIAEHFGDLLPVMLPDEDDGIDGLRTTVAKPFSNLGHVDSSFLESEEWPTFSNGCHVAVSLLGDHEAGPIIILQRTPPGEQATPELVVESDMCRCVIRGGYEQAGEDVAMGDVFFQAGGIPWGEVIAGPAGLDEVVIIGDRGGLKGGPAGWINDLSEVVEGLKAQLQEPSRRPSRGKSQKSHAS